ncbi:hypothetical protein D3C76_1567230 [compost metagenome]
MGVAKRAVKLSWLPSSPGLMKRNRFHSSPRWFSSGVPVATMRKSACKAIAAWERLVWAFLMACASSSTTLLQRRAEKASLSCCSKP